MSRRVSSPVLVGRRDELDALAAAFDRARAGNGGLVLVEGEAGIGKTRLIGEFVTHAELEGARALLGSCLPFADVVPYAPMARILGPLRAQDPTEVPPPGVAEPHDRARFFQWVVDRLTAMAVHDPVVVVVEDLHWADESTGDLLLYVANAAQDGPILVVGSRRPGEHDRGRGLSAALGELLRSGRAEQLVLAPLADDEVTRLIGEILGVDPSRGLRERVVARADGNPFFAEELVAAGGGDDLPATVGDVILQRVNRVGTDTRQLLQVAAVVGRRFGHSLLREIAGSAAPAMDAALRDAVSHQLLVTTHDHYSFRHALGHQAVYDDLLPGERIELHERIAVALSAHPELALGDDPAVAAAELAHHWHAAGRVPETLAASVVAGRAAEEAHAPIEADLHFRRAIELWPAVPDAEARAGTDRAWLLEHGAEAASLAGNHRRAADLADELLAELDPEREPQRHARALDRRALYLWYEGDVAKSRLVTEQLKVADHHVPTSATVTRRSGVAYQLALQLQYLEALTAAHQAVDEARRLGDSAELSFALYVLGSLEGHLGRHDDAIDRLQASLAVSLERGDTQRVGATWHNLVEAQVFAGRAADACEEATRALPELQRLGLSRTYVALTTGQLTSALLALGRWDGADAASGAVLADDVDPYFTLPVRFARLHLLVRRGRFQSAETVLDDLAATYGQNPFNAGVCAGWRAEMAIWRGDWTTARTALHRGFEITATSDEILLELRLAALAARLEADELSWARLNAAHADPVSSRLIAVDHVTGAATFLDRIDDAIGCCSLPFRRLLDLAKAELSRLDDRPPAKPWADLAAGAGDDAYLIAYAHWREAQALLATSGQRAGTRAETVLRAASAAAATLGAEPLLVEITDIARRARIDVAQLDPDDQERDRPDIAGELAALRFTKREVEVLELLAKGLSNREIGDALYISAKTASVHVTHIFQKLNVTTRVQAAVVAQRLAG